MKAIAFCGLTRTALQIDKCQSFHVLSPLPVVRCLDVLRHFL